MKYSAIQMNAFESVLMSCQGIPGGASGKELTCQCRIHETLVGSLGSQDPLKEEMATHSSFLSWEILWTVKPGGLQSIGSQRVRLK